jgi:hypothetical protein
VKFINAYRETISADIIATGEYSFKVFLIKVANHKSKDALPIHSGIYSPVLVNYWRGLRCELEITEKSTHYLELDWINGNVTYR